jgi:hypothetical protein
MPSGGVKRPQTRHRTGPLRKVVRVIHRSGQLYEQGMVELECGHRVRSNSRNRAHCGQCPETLSAFQIADAAGTVPPGIGRCPACRGKGCAACHNLGGVREAQ